MIRAFCLSWLLASGMLICGCTGTTSPTPRPEAWPRLAVYEPAYHPERFGPLTVQINDSARIDSIGPGWFNIVYPAYGITVNCTLTRSDDINGIIANRTDRFARNLGDRPARVASWAGRRLIVAPTALRTPVQFLLTDSATYVLSGVAVSNWPAATPADSVAPQIEALAADIAYLLR